MLETYGIGAICIALIGLVWKIWADSTKRADMMLEVIKQNALSHQELNQSIKQNTEVTKQSTDVAKATADVAKATGDTLSSLMLKVISSNNKKKPQ